MRQAKAYWALCAFAAALPCEAAARDWQPDERVAHYAVSGSTPVELYESIGATGPKAGASRAIAHTNWQLKWRRDYQPAGRSCILKSAVPFLIITYTLPKPKANLSGNAARLWGAFINGITAHEKVHGADIVAMVDEIVAGTAGLAVDNDSECRLIRAEVLKRVKAANEAYKAKARAFDRAEMAKGGNVHRLILALVNGR